MSAELLPVHVQVRADAELGRAWRRCETACPPTWELAFIRDRTGLWVAEAHDYDFVGGGPTALAALNALADALESR